MSSRDGNGVADPADAPTNTRVVGVVAVEVPLDLRDRDDDRTVNGAVPRARRRGSRGRGHRNDQDKPEQDNKQHAKHDEQDNKQHGKPHHKQHDSHDNKNKQHGKPTNKQRGDGKQAKNGEHEKDGNSGGHQRGGKKGGPSGRAKLVLFIVGIAAVALAVLFVVFLHLRHSHANDKERKHREDELAKGPEIPTATVLPAPKTRRVTLPGDVKALKLAVVYARVSGYLTDLEVDRGDKVVKDQVLGRVTTPDVELQLGPLISNLNTKSVIANRLRPLVAKGVVSQQDLDRADADVQQAKSEVDRLKAVKSFDVIRAPFDGVVTKRYVDVGALMPAPTGSTQSAQPLVDVADTSKVRVVVYVGQRDATGVHLGDKLTITRDDDPAHPITGSVTRIPEDLDLRTRTMWVECELPNPDGRLFPGLFVTVTLDVPAADGVLIPSASVAIVDGKTSVAVIDEGGIVKYTPIVIADDDGKVARVVNGLKAGQQVANRVSDEVADGAKVRPVTPEQLRQKQQDEKSNDGKGSGAGPGSGAAAKAPNYPGSEAAPAQTGPATPNFTGSASQGAGYGAAGSADAAKRTDRSDAGQRTTP
jgi:RND family efflux transporter MFP subunit